MYGRENILMETAMVIMTIFCNLCIEGDIDFDPFELGDTDNCIDLLEYLQYFCNLAREFEDLFSETEEYKSNFIELLGFWVTEKLIQKYGVDD